MAAQSLRPPPPSAGPAPPRAPRPSAPTLIPCFCGRGVRGRGVAGVRRVRPVARPRPCGGCARLHPRRARRPSRPPRPRSPHNAPHRLPPRHAPRFPHALCRGGVGGAGAGSSRPRPPARAVAVCRGGAAAVGRVRQLKGGLVSSDSGHLNPWSKLVPIVAPARRRSQRWPIPPHIALPVKICASTSFASRIFCTGQSIPRACAAAGGCVTGGIEPPAPQSAQGNTACSLLAFRCGLESGLSSLHKITTAIGFLNGGCRDGR